MKLFKWEEGRQRTGYFKMPLMLSKWPIPFDWYLLKFPEDSYLDTHIDSVKDCRHFRLNIVLKKAGYGGYFLCNSNEGMCKRWWRFVFFRPDISPHSVSRIEGATRYVLSIGWTL